MPTNQYQITDGFGRVRNCDADAAALTLTMASSGELEGNDGNPYTVNQLILYYIGSNSPFVLTITGTNPTINGVSLTIVSGSPQPRATWTQSGTSLVITFLGPESDSEAIWQFDDSAPPLNLQVKVKRQANAITC
ncbi:hypothetical protein [Enhygromyxa salina]|uniref:Uncharacterized protein n=1 Tax=Enhygromyxa salina TaxID=215803 RepID=A0A2S9Y4F8_9BACT|nr:hypothetical protein [Enhygromyxa salina]PRP99978.1 hypothetical protein ENSA7_61950 [Enhygromyxa salina]